MRTAHESWIGAMFDASADGYDRLNHLLSVGQDVLWRAAAARRARLGPGQVALDVGTGTGDLAFALLARSAPSARVVGVDLAERMCELARAKSARLGHAGRFLALRASALALPLPDAAVDRVVSGFTMRNVADLDRALSEMARVLRPGGRAVILELSWPGQPLWRSIYRAYFTRVLPRAAVALGGDRETYRWLPASLEPFPAPPQLARRCLAAGFARLRYTSLSMGIATIHEAWR